MPTSAFSTYAVPRVIPLFNPDDAFASTLDVAIAASQTIAAGTVLGKVTSGGKYKAYATGASDGSQNPVGILMYSVVTDSNGLITNWSDLGGVPGSLVVPMYTEGTFAAGDITGYDSGASTAAGMKNINVI